MIQLFGKLQIREELYIELAINIHFNMQNRNYMKKVIIITLVTVSIIIMSSYLLYNEILNSYSYTSTCTDDYIATKYKIDVSWIDDYGLCATIKSNSIFSYNQESILLGNAPINNDLNRYELELIESGKFIRSNRSNIRPVIINEFEYTENGFSVEVIAAKTTLDYIENAYFHVFFENDRIPVKGHLRISSRFMYEIPVDSLKEHEILMIKEVVSKLIQSDN